MIAHNLTCLNLPKTIYKLPRCKHAVDCAIQMSFATVRAPDFRLPVLYFLTDLDQLLLFREEDEVMSSGYVQQWVQNQGIQMPWAYEWNVSSIRGMSITHVNTPTGNNINNIWTMVTTLDQFSPPNQKQSVLHNSKSMLSREKCDRVKNVPRVWSL